MRQTSRARQKEQTKDTLLAAAYALYSKQGFLDTRMSDIAQAAGVSHGTVFLHFKTQEALITAVVETYCGRIAARTHELAGSGSSLREMLREHLAGIEESEAFYSRLVLESRRLPTPARDAWIQLQSAVSFHFSRAAEREAAAGKIRNLPPHLLFNTWMGLVHYYLANGDLFAPDGKVLERYGETLLETYMNMILQGEEGGKV